MIIVPNMKPAQRIAYVILGASAVVAALFAPQLRGAEALIIGVAGAATVVSGGVGF